MPSKVLSQNYGAEWASKQFVPIPTDVFRKLSMVGVTGTDQLIVLQLLSHKSSASDPFPSVKTLATGTGLNEATIQRHLKELGDSGLIIIKERAKDGRQLSNSYNLKPLLDKILLYDEDAHQNQRKASEPTATSPSSAAIMVTTETPPAAPYFETAGFLRLFEKTREEINRARNLPPETPFTPKEDEHVREFIRHLDDGMGFPAERILADTAMAFLKWTSD